MFCQVIINNDSKEVDKGFTYEVPVELIKNLKVGSRVTVPFGIGNKQNNGFIIKILESFTGNYKLKKILGIEDDFLHFEEEDLFLIEEMRKRYLCTYIEAIRAIAPAGAMEGLSQKKIKKLYVEKELQGKHLKENYIEICHAVKNNNGVFNKTQLSREKNLSISSINTLIKHGYLREDFYVVSRFDKRIFTNYKKPKLTFDQNRVIEEILNSENNKFLIHGITGSGKTEIYMSIVEEYMKRGMDSIILVPEISLTPQMVERFKGRFGSRIAVFHSGLSKGEKFDEWLRVKNGEVKIAIGARSAIFLPFKNLSVVIIDEEHESSYKSENNPKYVAREIAEIKERYKNIKIVLGSATPSIDLYYKGLKKEYNILTLKARADKEAKLPSTVIVNMKEELKNNNKTMFSLTLIEEMRKSLSRKEQIILFLNRRGFSTFVSCRSCGFVFKCKNCDISLTFHKNSSNLTCHYCGYTNKVMSTCPKCRSKYVKHFGTGTEKVEEYTKELFPQAKILRMDFDTTRKKNSYEDIYNSFKNGDGDILIGTQMIAKGLDFKDVTLVGVIAADLTLNLPDYKASERTFQLLTQVAGRAGRGRKEGKVIIQTYSPESSSIVSAANHDYTGFYEKEIEIRKKLRYPPFSNILLINLLCKDEMNLIKSSHLLCDNLKGFLKEKSVELLGPAPCSISKVKENYRWQIIIKGDFTYNFAKEVKNISYKVIKTKGNSVKLSMDINPYSIL